MKTVNDFERPSKETDNVQEIMISYHGPAPSLRSKLTI